MFELIGVVGITLSVTAYVPQVVHLIREHCSAGISNRSWVMWLASSILVGAVAVRRADVVFILLQLSSFTAAVVILFYSRRYQGEACEGHVSSNLTHPMAIRPMTDTEQHHGRTAAHG